MVEISIIVPVYEVEEYLNRCVESILEQSYKDFELILVDDGSTDKSPMICDNWAKKDNRVIVIHKENGGASSSRNCGLKIAKGKWITFIDSDDWINRDMLCILHRYAVQYDIPMVIGGIKICKEYTKQCIYSFDNIDIKVLSRKDLLNRFFRINGESDTHSVWGMIVKRELLDGYHFIEGRMNEDVETCYYLSRKCDSALYVNVPLYNYFKNNKGVTNSCFNKKKLDLIYIWDIVREQVNRYTPEYRYACDMNYKRASFTLLTQMNINGYDHSDPYMKKVKKRLKRAVISSFFDLLKWKMPLNRKVLLLLDCIIP